MNWFKQAQINILQPWQMTPQSKEYADISISDLDRAAFGFAREDIKTLSPNQINIKWQDDLDDVIHEQKNSGITETEWASKIDLSTPIDVVFENGKFYLEDGHHRWYAAKILNKSLPVNLEIKDKPHKAIIEKALYENKPVPPEILQSYPDLLKRFTK